MRPRPSWRKESAETPTLESMPNVKFYELEEPDIALFNGTWEPTENIFTDGVFVELENIITAFNPPKIMITGSEEPVRSNMRKNQLKGE